MPKFSSGRAFRLGRRRALAPVTYALDGVRKVFLYCLPEGIDGFVKAATAAGVEHVVALRADNLVRLVCADALAAPIHERDIAAVAVAALRGADGTSATLTGPELMTQRRQVELIAQAAGRPIRRRGRHPGRHHRRRCHRHCPGNPGPRPHSLRAVGRRARCRLQVRTSP